MHRQSRVCQFDYCYELSTLNNIALLYFVFNRHSQLHPKVNSNTCSYICVLPSNFNTTGDICFFFMYVAFNHPNAFRGLFVK